MTIAEWFKQTKTDISHNPRIGIKKSLHQLYLGGLRRLNPLFATGTNVYEKDWELLLILDGCRVDALESVADDYSFLATPGTLRSVGSTSREWVDKTFTTDYQHEIENTIYITANPYADRTDTSSFLHFEDHHSSGWNERVNTVPADVLTETAIQLGRDYAGEYDRMIVHYMQPHLPSVPDPLPRDEDSHFRETGWYKLQRGELSAETVWDAYLTNLRYVLDSVAELLENIDAGDVVISADHGNAKGEWGVYAHPASLPLKCLREVPWYRTTAEDTGTIDPEPDRTNDDEIDAEDRLKALGYL